MTWRDAPVAIALRRNANLAAKAVTVVARPRAWVETLALLVVLVFGLLALVVFDAVVRYGLWGEFASAMIGCSLGVWGLGRLLKKELQNRYPFITPRWWQAPIWAAVPLVGGPFAALTWPWGTVVFLSILVGLLLVFSLVSWTPPPRLHPVQWVAALLAVAAVTAFVATDTATDVGHAAAATPPVAGGMELAMRYRPELYFDSQERYFPMNIDVAMKDGRVEQCRYTLGRTPCTEVDDAAQLDSKNDFLSIEGGSAGFRADTGGPTSAIYVHVSQDGPHIFLDYWVYYAQNPLPVAKHILCAPGLRAPELTCFEHPADWEGLTVVLSRCRGSESVNSPCHSSPAGEFRITGVHYAEHRNVQAFAWNTLLQRWVPRGLASPGDERPLAFIALDSHASYPLPCRSGCPFEGDYNGRLPWGNNGDQCGTTCVQALPVTSDGAPASWNAFAGHWGPQHCILLGAYCDVGPAPRAPAFQTRYKQPWNAK